MGACAWRGVNGRRIVDAPVVNARMYSATPQAKQAWKALFREVLERAGLDWEILDDAPAPLSAL